VHEEGHDAGGQDVIANEGVPGGPETLEVVELDVVLGDLFELAPVSAALVWEGGVEDGGRVSVGNTSVDCSASRRGVRSETDMYSILTTLAAKHDNQIRTRACARERGREGVLLDDGTK